MLCARRFAAVLVVVIGAAAFAPVARGAVWVANSYSGVDNATTCGVQPQLSPCATLAFTMTLVRAGDTLQLTDDGADEPVPFAVPHNVFVNQPNVTVQGTLNAAAGGYPTVACVNGSSTAIYITASGSALANLQITDCAMTAVIYDFESYSAGHSVSGVTFFQNYKAIGAEDCELTVTDSVVLAGTAGGIVMGGGALTVAGTVFNANAQAPLGALGGSLMCAKCRSLTVSDSQFTQNAPSAASRAQQLPVVWVGYASGPVTFAQNLWQSNSGTGLVVVGCGPDAPVTIVDGTLISGGEGDPVPGPVASLVDVRNSDSLTIAGVVVQLTALSTNHPPPSSTGSFTSAVYVAGVRNVTVGGDQWSIGDAVVQPTPPNAPLVDALIAVGVDATTAATTVTWTGPRLNTAWPFPDAPAVPLATSALAFIAPVKDGVDAVTPATATAAAGASATLIDLQLSGSGPGAGTGLPYVVACNAAATANAVTTSGVTPALNAADVQCGTSTCALTVDGAAANVCPAAAVRS